MLFPSSPSLYSSTSPKASVAIPESYSSNVRNIQENGNSTTELPTSPLPVANFVPVSTSVAPYWPNPELWNYPVGFRDQLLTPQFLDSQHFRTRTLPPSPSSSIPLSQGQYYFHQKRDFSRPWNKHHTSPGTYIPRDINTSRSPRERTYNPLDGIFPSRSHIPDHNFQKHQLPSQFNYLPTSISDECSPTLNSSFSSDFFTKYHASSQVHTDSSSIQEGPASLYTPYSDSIADTWLQYRRDTHKQVEKRRRENINAGISELARIVPECDRNKGRIVHKSVDYIKYLQRARLADLERWRQEKLNFEMEEMKRAKKEAVYVDEIKRLKLDIALLREKIETLTHVTATRRESEDEAINELKEKLSSSSLDSTENAIEE